MNAPPWSSQGKVRDVYDVDSIGCCRYTAQAIIRGRELRALLLGIKQFTDETFLLGFTSRFKSGARNRHYLLFNALRLPRLSRATLRK